MALTARGTALLVSGPLLLAAGFGFGYRELVVLGCAALLAVASGVAYAAWRPRLAVTRTAEPDRVVADVLVPLIRKTSALRLFLAFRDVSSPEVPAVRGAILDRLAIRLDEVDARPLDRRQVEVEAVEELHDHYPEGVLVGEAFRHDRVGQAAEDTRQLVGGVGLGG